MFKASLKLSGFLAIVLALLLSVPAGAAPESAKTIYDAKFAQDVDLAEFSRLIVQDRQTLKTFDTYAREALYEACAGKVPGGASADFVVLDMAIRPAAYIDANIIYIRNKPFREDFSTLKFLSKDEQERIVKEGTISLSFWLDPRVQEGMAALAASATQKLKAINETNQAANQLAVLLGFGSAGQNAPPSGGQLPQVAMVPPAPGETLAGGGGTTGASMAAAGSGSGAGGANGAPWRTIGVVTTEVPDQNRETGASPASPPSLAAPNAPQRLGGAHDATHAGHDHTAGAMPGDGPTGDAPHPTADASVDAPAGASAVSAVANRGMYPPELVSALDQHRAKVLAGWRAGDAVGVSAGLNGIAAVLPAVRPDVYPSHLKRTAEIIYNRLAKLTLPGAAFYCIAFVLFLLGLRTGKRRLTVLAAVFMCTALLVHTLGIGVRWWLIEKSVGSWFYAIPIKNQFESVLMSAFFGSFVLLALTLLGLRKGRKWGPGIFGLAGSGVGALSLLALFAAPYFTDRNIGSEIGQATGILMSYWLYVHVTMVTASYALITATLVMGLLWLTAYYRSYRTLGRLSNPRQLSADARDATSADTRYGDTTIDTTADYGDGYSAGGTATLAPPARSAVTARGGSTAAATVAYGKDESRLPAFLATIDKCNMVMLQLAFLTLGVGIVLGAVWADMSWGRPWGWDPKETFALITWIGYLVILHVRLVTADKAWWTSVLSVAGFGVMLFNWIGVNFFLVGLHSYA